MYNNYEDLIKIKSRFDSEYVQNQKLIYSYIAPKNEKEYNLFISIVANIPTLNNSYFEILSKVVKVEEILFNNFKNSDFEIYININDNTGICLKTITLNQYISLNKIDFKR